jgi:glycosyltransferase involved in cell wall biosynthesis
MSYPIDPTLITPVILTYNEAPNIARCLQSLTWAQRIVVVDTGSTDETLTILNRFSQVEVFHRAFDDHSQQWNFGVAQVLTPWVLAFDADYIASDELIAELSSMQASSSYVAYFAKFHYHILGKRLRASLYPPRAVLFHQAHAVYEQDGHTQQLRIEGSSGFLKHAVIHDDRKPLSRWVVSQDRYAELEAQKLLTTPTHELRVQDRLRRTGWAAIPATLLYTLLVKGTIFDGWRGWYYALQRCFAEVLLALRLLEARFNSKS